MKLAEKRVVFSQLLSKLVTWAQSQGYDLAYGEGYVALTDARDGDYDGPHKRGGSHYTGLGHDMILYRWSGPEDDRWFPVTNGEDKAWYAIGSYWERMHPYARWGGRFGDANHFSFEHEGIK